jgi:hypothetical protein
MVCGLINDGTSVNCDDLILGGTNSTSYFINYDDIESITKVNGRITAITLKEDKIAYAFSAGPSDIKISQETFQTRRKRNFKHTVGITIYDRTQAQKINMSRMLKGLFVVIVHLKGDDNDAIVVAGEEVGLVHQPANVQDAYANGGNYLFTFTTEEFESNIISSLGEDYEDALNIIEGLLGNTLFGIELEDSLDLVELEDSTDIILLQ